MRRVLRPHPSQLTLRLAPELEPVPPLLTAEEPTLVQALADLLLSALGQPAPGAQTRAATIVVEGSDEPEDHP
jgi:hypothetical protein